MKNYIEPGDTIDVIAAANVVSGQLVIMGDFAGVATTTALSGATFALKLTGVFELPKISAQAWTVGAKIYWDGTADLATTVSTSNTLIGRATEPAANPSAVGRVKLSTFSL